VLPMFINEASVDAADRHRVLRYNQIIGGIQIQQVRRKKVTCSTEYPDLGPFPRAGRTNPLLADFGCYPWYSESDDCYGPWNRTARDNLPGGFCPDSKRDQETGLGLVRLLGVSSEGRRLDFVPEGGGAGGTTKGARDKPGPEQLFTVFMYEYEGLDRALEKLHQLAEHEWIDYNTAWVGVRMLIFNPDLAIFMHVTVHVYFAPSGALLPHITAQSFAPDPYQYMSVIAFDVIFLLLLLYLVFSLMKKVHTAAKKGSIKAFVADIWIWLDVGMVVGGLVAIILWMVLLDRLVTVKSLAMDVRAAEPAQGFSSDIYPELVASLHNNMSELSEYLETLRLIFCWYTIFISLKFLESFSAQPRLAVVTKTIYSAGSELFHFLIVLFIIFVSYVIAGMFIFGRRLWEFSTFQQAITKCFLLMLGDFNWEELGDENPLTAAFWFWTYMIVMMLLMMNMLMAIIMDKYTEVKSDAASHDTIITQIATMCTESFRSRTGSAVSTDRILKNVEAMPQHEISEDDLCGAVPDLSKQQAGMLVKRTREKVDMEINKGVTMSEAMRMIGWVKIAVQKIGWKLEEVLKDEREERNIMRASYHGGQDGNYSEAGHGQGGRFSALEGGSPSSPGMTMDGPGSPEEPGPLATYEGGDRGPPYVADAEERLERIEMRMAKMEEFMQEALQYTTFRGKDLRNRLAVIEDLIRSQRDATMSSQERSVWDGGPPRLADGGYNGGGNGNISFSG